MGRMVPFKGLMLAVLERGNFCFTFRVWGPFIGLIIAVDFRSYIGFVV